MNYKHPWQGYAILIASLLVTLLVLLTVFLTGSVYCENDCTVISVVAAALIIYDLLLLTSFIGIVRKKITYLSLFHKLSFIAFSYPLFVIFMNVRDNESVSVIFSMPFLVIIVACTLIVLVIHYFYKACKKSGYYE